MKKLLYIGLLMMNFGQECNAMNNVKRVTKWLPAIFAVNGVASMASGSRDGMNGGVMKGEARIPRIVSAATACGFLIINPLLFVCNVGTQKLIYSTAYKKGKTFQAVEY